MSRTRGFLLALPAMTVLAFASGTEAGDTDPRACARIAKDAARLACYDAVFGRASSGGDAKARASSGGGASTQSSPGVATPGSGAPVTTLGTTTSGGGASEQTAARVVSDHAALAASSAGSGVAAPSAGSPAQDGAARDPVAAFGDRGQLPATKRAQTNLPKRMEFHVAKAEPLASGLYRLTMDNGQVWVTREANWALEFKSGDTVTIQRMVLGAFRISHTGEGRDVSVARIL